MLVEIIYFEILYYLENIYFVQKMKRNGFLNICLQVKVP